MTPNLETMAAVEETSMNANNCHKFIKTGNVLIKRRANKDV